MRIILVATVFLVLVACSVQSGVFHRVSDGETLSEICSLYGKSLDEVASLNGIKSPEKIRAGQRIFIPGVLRQYNAPVGSETINVQEAPRSSQDYVGEKPMRSSVVPIKGRVVSEYGGTSSSMRGVELSSSGPQIFSAVRDGQVIYASNGIAGFGNLVIVKHAGDLFSVYGYASRLSVEKGNFVRQGDELGVTGRKPMGKEYLLYFEMRRGRTPINPMKYIGGK